MKNMKKVLVMTMAALLLVAVSVAGTVAYLTATSETVTNKFVSTTVGVELEETTGEEYKLIPGVELAKDPFVTVLAGSEEVYVYVEVTKSEGFDTYVAYEMAEGWEPVTNTTNVYYWKDKVSTLDGNDSDPIAVLKGDKVTVSKDITKDGMPETEPTIEFEAHVIQTATFADAVIAWNTVNAPNP